MRWSQDLFYFIKIYRSLLSLHCLLKSSSLLDSDIVHLGGQCIMFLSVLICFCKSVAAHTILNITAL